MSWQALEPPRPKTPKAAMVVMAVTKPGRQVQRAILLVREDKSLGALTWWKPDAKCSVALGQGEHSGRIRCSKGGPFRLGARMGSKEPGAVLSLRGLPDMPKAGFKGVAVAWEVAGDALIVMLPWVTAKPAEAPVDKAPATAKPKPTPTPTPIALKPAPTPATAPSGPVVEMAYASVIPLAQAASCYSATHGIDLLALNAARVADGKRPIKLRRAGAA